MTIRIEDGGMCDVAKNRPCRERARSFVPWSLATAILTLTCLYSAARANGTDGARDATPRHRPLLKSIYTGRHSLSEFTTERTKALVLVFMSCDCPVAQRYVPTLKELHQQRADDGVVVLAVYSNSGDHLMKMARHAQDMDLPFPVLHDTRHRLADVLEVERTPEAVVLDAGFQKRYQGAIDNQFTKRGQLQAATEHYVRDAIDSLLRGEPVSREFAAASGCPIERRPPPVGESTLTYYRDVAPIIQRRCQTCHREGEVAPFELMSYEDAYHHASTIAEVVEERRMPPWHGFLNPEFGELKNDMSLDSEEIRTLIGWVRQGAVAGDRRAAPPPVRWPDANAWRIGTPDYVYRMPRPFRVPKSGVLEYQFFRVPLDLEEDRWIRAVEVRPGNREVVHHVGLHVVESGHRRYTGFSGMAALYGFNTEKANLLNDYVPGDTYNAKIYPPGQAVRIPKGSDLIYEVHYTPNNREATTDQSMAAFRWADRPPETEVRTTVFRKPIGRFRIPPHHRHYRMRDSYHFENDVLIDAIRPHFHYRGKSFRLELIRRDRRTDRVVERKTILSVPAWDPDWQRTYELKTPLLVQAGVELLATGHFDNSSLNPNNPDPSAEVLWGQQTADEMFSTRFKYRLATTVPEERWKDDKDDSLAE